MKTERMRLYCVVLFCALFLGMARGEQPPPPNGDTPPKDGGGDKKREPNELTPEMQELLQSKDKKPAQVVVAPAPPKAPQFLLKGFVLVPNKPPIATVEVNGKDLFMIRENSQFTVKSTDQRELMVKVKKLDADAVELEIPELKETIILR